MSLKSAEKTGTNEYTLELAIGGESFEASVNKVFNKNKNKFVIPGFRKGKAPRKRIEMHYGENVFYDDALEDAFPAVYEAALKEAGIEPVDSPRDFDIKSIGKEGVELVCLVTVKPEITLGQYKGLIAVKDEVSVSEADVTDELEHMREHNARRIDVDDRAAGEGDIVTIDFEGSLDGVPFEGGKDEECELTLGSGRFIPGFEENIIGHNAGEEFEIDVTFPEDYAEELAGKDAVFKIKLNAIQVEELPELDDDFATEVSDKCDTLDELKESIREDIRQRRQSAADSRFESAVLDKVAEAAEGDIPDCMTDKELDRIVSDYEYRMRSQGTDFNMYLQYMGTDIDSFRESMSESALKRVKLDLALEKIAQIEGIEPDDEEIEAEYARLAENYKMELEKLKAIILAENIKKDLITKKTADFIIAAAVAVKAEEESGEQTEADEAAPKTAKKKPAAKKAAEAGAETAEEPAPKKEAKKAAAKKIEEETE